MSRDELLTAEYGETEEKPCTEPGCTSTADIRLDCGRELCTPCVHEVFLLRGGEQFRARMIGTVELLRLDVVEIEDWGVETPEPMREVA